MYGKIQCSKCRQLLSPEEFEFNMSTRKRLKECKVCKHKRLAKYHQRQFDILTAERRRLREESYDRIRRARLAAGRD